MVVCDGALALCVYRADHAFNPKDRDHWKNDASVGSMSEAKDVEIRKRIGRLLQTLANKVRLLAWRLNVWWCQVFLINFLKPGIAFQDVVSQLPDKGERIRRQIDELNLELNKIQNSHRMDAEVIDLDDISGRLEKLRTDWSFIDGSYKVRYAS